MRAVGAAGVSIVLVAIVVDLTLLPALCALGAKRLVPRRQATGPDRGVFSRLARFVQGRPVTVIVVTLAALLALAWPAVSMKLTSSGVELLPVSAPERVFFDDLARDYPAPRISGRHRGGGGTRRDDAAVGLGLRGDAAGRRTRHRPRPHAAAQRGLGQRLG